MMKDKLLWLAALLVFFVGCGNADVSTPAAAATRRPTHQVTPAATKVARPIPTPTIIPTPTVASVSSDSPDPDTRLVIPMECSYPEEDPAYHIPFTREEWRLGEGIREYPTRQNGKILVGAKETTFAVVDGDGYILAAEEFAEGTGSGYLFRSKATKEVRFGPFYVISCGGSLWVNDSHLDFEFPPEESPPTPLPSIPDGKTAFLG